ncbi:MAG: hypothetical protein HQK49_09405 [Oligoflexia bacterium]|nr:hypothetical protein [Oligoflexia bacterium]
MTARILIIESDIGLLTVLNLLIRREYDVEIVSKVSRNMAIEYLKKDQNFICILADDESPRGAACKIAKETMLYEKTIPVIALVNQFSASMDSKNIYAKVVKPEISKPLIQVLKTFLPKRITASKLPIENDAIFDHSLASTNNYFFIKLDEIICFNYLEVDFYVKLSEEKYLKVINKGDLFSDEDYKKYKNRKIDGLYILNEDVNFLIERSLFNFKTLYDLNFYTSAENLANFIFNKNEVYSEEKTTNVINMINESLRKADANKLKYEEGLKVCEETVAVIYKTVSKFGMNHVCQHLTRASVILSLSFIRSSPPLNNLLEMMKESVFETGDSYLIDHSVLLANVACVLAGLRGWNSNLTFYKLSLAALLHDITLKNPSLARFRSRQDLMNKLHEFTEEELRLYTSHPQDSAKMAEQFRMIPPDIGLIILEHHERADGTGFPKKLDHSKISGLGQMFIVAHDLVSFILSKNIKQSSNIESEQSFLDLNLVSFLNKYRMLYQYGEFRVIFDVLWNYAFTSARKK